MDIEKRERLDKEKRDKASYKLLFKTEEEEQEKMHFWIDMIHNDSGYEPEKAVKRAISSLTRTDN